jgi:hypothetical protein
MLAAVDLSESHRHFGVDALNLRIEQGEIFHRQIATRKLGRTTSQRWYPVGSRQLSTSAVFRIVATAMIGVLLQTMFLSANCMVITTDKAGTSVEDSQQCPDGAERDAGCCSSCVCCHFAGVLNFNGLSLSLVANGFLAPNWNQPPHQSFISPFDQPPRP